MSQLVRSRGKKTVQSTHCALLELDIFACCRFKYCRGGQISCKLAAQTLSSKCWSLRYFWSPTFLLLHSFPNCATLDKMSNWICPFRTWRPIWGSQQAGKGSEVWRRRRRLGSVWHSCRKKEASTSTTSTSTSAKTSASLGIEGDTSSAGGLRLW